MKGDQANKAASAGQLELLALAQDLAKRAAERSRSFHAGNGHAGPWHRCNVQPCVNDYALIYRVNTWRP